MASSGAHVVAVSYATESKKWQIWGKLPNLPSPYPQHSAPAQREPLAGAPACKRNTAWARAPLPAATHFSDNFSDNSTTDFHETAVAPRTEAPLTGETQSAAMPHNAPRGDARIVSNYEAPKTSRTQGGSLLARYFFDYPLACKSTAGPCSHPPARTSLLGRPFGRAERPSGAVRTTASGRSEGDVV